MCPEPSFGMEYRALIETYRLTPEAAMNQLDIILDRFFDNDQRGRGKKTVHTPKGGIST